MQITTTTPETCRVISAYTKYVTASALPSPLAARIAQVSSVNGIADALKFYETGFPAYTLLGSGLMELGLQYSCGFTVGGEPLQVLHVVYAGLFLMGTCDTETQEQYLEPGRVDALVPHLEAFVAPILAAIGLPSIKLTFPFHDDQRCDHIGEASDRQPELV